MDQNSLSDSFDILGNTSSEPIELKSGERVGYSGRPAQFRRRTTGSGECSVAAIQFAVIHRCIGNSQAGATLLKGSSALLWSVNKVRSDAIIFFDIFVGIDCINHTWSLNEKHLQLDRPEHLKHSDRTNVSHGRGDCSSLLFCCRC